MTRRILTARDQVALLAPWRHAAANYDMVDRLHNEFNDWWLGKIRDNDTGLGQDPPNGFAIKVPEDAIYNWPHVEAFLQEHYPAAHRGLGHGFEHARSVLDEPERMKNSYGIKPYETGPDAVTQHGYDPKEVAAAMLLLHQRDEDRRDLWDEDQQRLTDIAQKRFQMQRNYEQRQTTAAVTQDLVDRLHHEFHQWHKTRDRNSTSYKDWKKYGDPDAGPISNWPSIESFLKDRYPAAHRGFDMGLERVMPSLDFGHFTTYETGPEAEAQHGYDPAEVVAGMLLLHNKSHPLRGDLEQEDQARLNDIAQKRFQMQRAYEQRQTTARHWMP